MRSERLVERILAAPDDVTDHLVVAPGILDHQPLSRPTPLRRELLRLQPVESAPELDRLATHRRAAQSVLPQSLDLHRLLGKAVLDLGKPSLVELIDGERVPLLELGIVPAPDHVRS